MDWIDEITLISEVSGENRVNKNGFAVKLEESARTVFCNKKSVGYSEYFKSQQTGKLVEAKYEVHKADYGGEDGAPKKMAEAMTADLSVKTADGSLYADDTLSESVTEFASGTLKLGIKDLTPEVLAELLGQEVDENSVVLFTVFP